MEFSIISPWLIILFASVITLIFVKIFVMRCSGLRNSLITPTLEVGTILHLSLTLS